MIDLPERTGVIIIVHLPECPLGIGKIDIKIVIMERNTYGKLVGRFGFDLPARMVFVVVTIKKQVIVPMGFQVLFGTESR